MRQPSPSAISAKRIVRAFIIGLLQRIEKKRVSTRAPQNPNPVTKNK